VSLDAICSNYEEKCFFRIEDPCSTQEVVCSSSLFATAYSLMHLSISGELGAALLYCSTNPWLLPKIVSSSILGYCSVTFILATIKFFGAAEAEIVKSMRKILSILVSFMVYPKELNRNYQFGLFAIVSAILLMLHHKRHGATPSVA